MTAAKTWPWERLNEGNASAHAALTALLEPRGGERWLDVGTGGGGLALELARAGADVTGVDVAEDGLEHARAEAATAGIDAVFERADAQRLPYADASFDGVASAFGVIFAPEPERAAAELARVCRPGGRLGLTLMPLDSYTGALFSALGRHGRRAPHPADWEARAEELLGDAFEVEVGRRESPPLPRPRPSWEEAVASFGSLRAVVEGLDEGGVVELRDELEEVERAYASRPRAYVLVVGRRR